MKSWGLKLKLKSILIESRLNNNEPTQKAIRCKNIGVYNFAHVMFCLPAFSLG